MPHIRRAGTALLTIAFAVSLLGASGDRSRFEDLGHHRLICVCSCNQMLLECNHVGCQYSDRMREQLMAAVQRDSSDDGVLQSFVQEYGTIVLAAPTARGFDKIAWVMPFAFLFAGCFIAITVIRNWKGRPPTPPAGAGDSSGLKKYVEQARKETEL